jgi:protease I
MKLRGKKIALFIEDMYNDREFWYPYYRMKEEGAEVKVIGPRKGTFTAKEGITAEADVAISEARPEDFDALIIPGGFAPDLMRRTRAMVDFVAGMHSKGKIVAAICHAGWLLASAGIAKGRTVTSFFAIKDDLVNAGANWVDQDVVKDGNIITSRKPDDLPAFSRTIIDALSRMS